MKLKQAPGALQPFSKGRSLGQGGVELPAVMNDGVAGASVTDGIADALSQTRGRLAAKLLAVGENVLAEPEFNQALALRTQRYDARGYRNPVAPVLDRWDPLSFHFGIGAPGLAKVGKVKVAGYFRLIPSGYGPLPVASMWGLECEGYEISRFCTDSQDARLAAVAGIALVEAGLALVEYLERDAFAVISVALERLLAHRKVPFQRLGEPQALGQYGGEVNVPIRIEVEASKNHNSRRRELAGAA